MTRPEKIFLTVLTLLACVGAAVAIVYFMYFQTPIEVTNTNTATVNKQTNSANTQNVNATVNDADTVNTNNNTNTNTTAPVTAKEKTDIEDQSDILRLARIFLEHYGTYSNRNNFENITSVEAFMTQSFAKESAAFIAKNKSTPTPEEYYGITTAVVSLHVEEYTRGERAVVRLGTRRQEMKGKNTPTTITQYAVVALKHVEGNWKIDGVTWE